MRTVSFNLLQHLNEVKPDSFQWFIRWLLMQMILSRFLPTVHRYRSARFSLMSYPKLCRNSLCNSLQKNTSLQYYSRELPSQREGFWEQLWKVRKEKMKKSICFLRTASTDHSPDFFATKLPVWKAVRMCKGQDSVWEVWAVFLGKLKMREGVMMRLQTFHL